MRASAILLLCAVCAGAVAANWHSPVRTVLALAFLVVAPGAAGAELVQAARLVDRLAIVAGTSMAVDTAVALIFIYAHAWSPGRALAILIALTTAMTLAAVLRAWRRGRNQPRAHVAP